MDRGNLALLKIPNILQFLCIGLSQNEGYHFGGPYNKDYGILGSILGSPYFGKLLYGE